MRSHTYGAQNKIQEREVKYVQSLGKKSLNTKSLKVTKCYLKLIYIILQHSTNRLCINFECTKITYTPVFNQSFQTCRHCFLIIINDKHSDFTTSAKLLLKGVRGKKTLTLKTGFSTTPISVTSETFSGMDSAGLCETEHRTGLGMRLAGQSQQ